MKRGYQILAILITVGSVSAAIGEHVYRRIVERRYQTAVDNRRQLELQLGEALATHEQVKRDLGQERQRSQELSQALASMRAQWEEAVGRLTAEAKTVQDLHMRLGEMQKQMGELQGELAMAMQERQGTGARSEAGLVQLERIVVSDGAAQNLQGRVLSVDRSWNFIVIDLGWDAVRIGDIVSIFRNAQLLAKARVDRVQAVICAATVLPEWSTAEIQINDLVRAL